MLSEPKGLGRLPCRILATHIISVFQVALALPITVIREQTVLHKHKYATCIIIVAWWCQYAIYLLHFSLLSHDARSFGLLRNSSFFLTMTSQGVLFHLLVS
jgi:hypothetical protein